MPLDPNISLNIKPVDTMSKLSDMLGVAQGAQAYQSNQLNLTKARALLQPEINQGIANSQSAQAKAQVDTANVQPLIQQQQAFTSQQQTAAQKAKFNLTGEQMQKGMDIATSLIQDPDIAGGQDSEAIIGKIASARQHMIDYGIPPAMAEASTADLISLAHKNPGAVRQELANRLMIGQGASGQAAQDLVPAGQQQSVVKDSANNNAILTRAQTGGIQGVSGMPTEGQQGVPLPTRPLHPGESDMIQPLTQETMAAKNAALNAGTMHNLNNTILNEIDKVEATGAMGGPIQHALSALGVVSTGAENKASSYDLIGKALERQALQAAQSMGPQTNAGLDAQIKANGSTAYNPTAIKRITKLNDALTSGQEAYYSGLDKAMKADPQSGVLVKKDFDQAWGGVFKPEIMELKNALGRGDKAEVGRIVQEAGGAGSAGAKDLMRRYQQMQQLSKTGHL